MKSLTPTDRMKTSTLILALAACGFCPAAFGQTNVLTTQVERPYTPPDTNEVVVVETAVATNLAEAVEAVETVEPEPPRAHSGPVQDKVAVGGSVLVAAGERAGDVVAVFGKARLEGVAQGDFVSVFGGSELAGGEVRGDMATVFGEAMVDGVVHGDMVTVFGMTTFGPGAAIDGDCVSVFGAVDGDPSAFVSGEVVEVFSAFGPVGAYVRNGLLKGRLIPPTNVFAWIVVGIHLVLYLLIVLLLPKPLASSRKQLRERPLQSFGVGLLVMLLMAPLATLLAMTGIGALLVPFIGIAELAFLLLGKAAILQVFGLQILRKKPDEEGPGFVAFLLGFCLLTLVYMVPIVALIAWSLLRPLSLGAPILAMFSNGNGNGNAAPPVPVGDASPPALGVASPGAEDSPAAPEEPASSDVQMMRRAGFWIRFAAAALDLLLLSWLVPFSDKWFVLIWIAYHIGLWAWRGTTIGGIVCRLKVVRTSGSPIDFGVALVRSLSSVFSAVPLFLGFFWVGWSSERQSWHDMIAGTVIVRVPKGVSLI